MQTPDTYDKASYHAYGSYTEKPVNLRSTNIRWLALVLTCFINFGPYFSVDNPQALQGSLEDQLNLTNVQFNMLYSVYSFPNIILPFFGGIIIDKLGARIAIASFAAIIIIGQSIVTFGVAQKSFALMVIGRTVFGLGGECLTVAQSAITAKWFKGKEVAFAMGASLCVSRLGSSLNSFTSPKIFNWTGELFAPFLLGAIFCTVSWLAGLGLALLDRKADKQEGGIVKAGETDKIRFQDFKEFNLIFYLLLFNCFFIYGAFFGLNNNLNDIMVSRFGFTQNDAGNFIPIVYIASAIITPFFGLFTDRFGKRVVFMIMSSVIFLIDHIFIAFLHDTTAEGRRNYGMVVALGGIGLFYSTYAAIFWPCVPLVVKENVVGTAYGIITALQNLMLTIIPMVLGAVAEGTKDFHSGYFWTEILLAGIVAIGLSITIWMYFVDIRTNGKLNKPSAKEGEEDENKALTA